MIIIELFINFISIPIFAQTLAISTVTGGFLVESCEHSEPLRSDFCNGYVLGASDRLQISGLICYPESDVGTLQVATIALQYIKDNPQEWHLHGTDLVKNALERAFPCPAS